MTSKASKAIDTLAKDKGVSDPDRPRLLYYLLRKRYTDDQIHAAIAELIYTAEYFPSVAEVSAQIEAMEPKEEPTDRGWVLPPEGTYERWEFEVKERVRYAIEADDGYDVDFDDPPWSRKRWRAEQGGWA